MRFAVLLCALTACGRFSFDSRPDGARPDDASADAGPRACPGFAVFCDGFETGDFSKWTAQDQTVPAAQLAVATTQVASGRYALEALMMQTQQFGEAADTRHDFALETTGTIAVRLWVYPLKLDDFSDVIYIGGTGHYVVTGVTNALVWNLTEDSPSGGIVDHNASTAITTDRWQCVEQDVDLAARTARVFLDESLIVDVSLTDTTPQYQNVIVGLPATATTAAHVFVDDVVLAHQHIGCE